MIEATKWIFRWLTVVISAMTLVYAYFTWKPEPEWYLCLLTNAAFYCHMTAMLLGWWKPSK